ncbi:hypothetical protein BKA82DRAFT_1005936, partial [Pisolithus tinctorius]
IGWSYSCVPRHPVPGEPQNSTTRESSPTFAMTQGEPSRPDCVRRGTSGRKEITGSNI